MAGLQADDYRSTMNSIHPCTLPTFQHALTLAPRSDPGSLTGPKTPLMMKSTIAASNGLSPVHPTWNHQE